MTDSRQTLNDLRQQIDALDQEIQTLLMKRSEIVLEVGRVKQAAAGAEDPSFLRPSREAAMLRRLVSRQRGPFPKPVLIQIWHEIIGAMVRLEGPFSVVVAMPEDAPGLWDLARNQYGGHAPIAAVGTAAEALDRVDSGDVVVGVLPFPEPGSEMWWTDARIGAEGGPHVFARLPFGDAGSTLPGPGGREPIALAIGRILMEPTGDDRTVVRTAAGTRLPDMVDVVELVTGPDGSALLDVSGFCDDIRRHLAETLKPDDFSVLGGYASPLTASDLS